jgi:alanyl-tRNA synthetase
MTSQEIRKKFLEFFEKRGHKFLSSASLVPENDPSALFTTAGVQPLVPYILQGKHPLGNRLVSIQKCVRTTDIEEVGDNTHATFFEMLGNWSIGDYFKEEAVEWSFKLLTDEEEGFGLDPKRLYVTVFEGDGNAPRDEDSVELWKKAGIPENRIYFRGKDNWWPQPKEKDEYSGPCGPSTEMFYDLTEEGLGDLTPEEFEKADDEQKVVEVWNDVFMEYKKENGKVVGTLPNKNVDTGAGFERLLAVLQNKKNIYDTDLFEPIMEITKEFTQSASSQRIIADHIRASIFLIADGVLPSNTERGYVLRRLIRRSMAQASGRNITQDQFNKLVDVTLYTYKNSYPELERKREEISQELHDEALHFREALKKGLKEFEKGKDAFVLFSTHGFPFELTLELAKEKGIKVDIKNFEKKFKEHQEKSRTASAGMFKGGLADQSEETVKLHTAHHLLLAALQKVLGKEVKQQGSNITSERLRIDFSFERKLTDEEKSQVETQVNEWIKAGFEVVRKEMKREEAEKMGAEMEFGTKYPDMVSVYIIQGKNGEILSKEFCGGPHVKNTGELGKFRIKKEGAVAAGVRRVKAMLE